ncbi:MAG TPA: hypothetical protein VKE74_11100, partial [Gemmataceae bacterium]|nr:hypothetical protein [Gemmataceae bacterium]
MLAVPPTPGTLTPEQDDLLERAAELRAGGSSWELAARKLNTDHDALRQLARAHRAEYERHHARSRREVMRDSFAEALLALRTLVR